MDIQKHGDETIIAARILQAALVSDSPNKDPQEAEKWADAYAPIVAKIAQQQTEEEGSEVSL